MRIVIAHQAVGKESAPDDVDVLSQVNAISSALTGIGHSSASTTLPIPYVLPKRYYPATTRQNSS